LSFNIKLEFKTKIVKGKWKKSVVKVSQYKIKDCDFKPNKKGKDYGAI